MIRESLSDLPDRVEGTWRSRRATVAFASGVALFVPLGFYATTHQKYALAGGLALFGLGLFATNLNSLAVLALPCTLLVIRVGSGSSGLSASDLILLLATSSVLPSLRVAESPRLRTLLWLLVGYQATTLLAVVYNPYRANVVEWFHEALLVSGSLVVGWVTGSAGKAKAAMTTFLAGSAVLAVWASGYSVVKHFHPANLPFGMQKNFVGCTLAFAIVLAYARPQWSGLQGRWLSWAIPLYALGVLASQSRQAMLAVAVGIGVVVIRGNRVSGRSKLVLALIVPLLVIVYVTLKQQLASHNQFNSVNQRLSFFHQSSLVWHTSQWFGVGLRWWYTNRFQFNFQPPNAELEMLTSAGVVGLMGFVVLIIGALWVLWQLPREFATLALAFVIMRIVEGQLDVFWVAPLASTPWLITGMALGAMTLGHSAPSAPDFAEVRRRRRPLTASR